MGIFKQIPPTAGFLFSLKDFFDVLKPAKSKESLEEVLKRYLIVPHVCVTSSGTAALYIILETLKFFSSKKTVIIPAFVSPAVAAAVIRSGLKVAVCDIAQDSFDFDHLELEKICISSPDILAVIPVHLGGIPIDLERILRLAKRYNFYVIEDCAQSLGALYRSRKVGTFGDFSFFSFARGKGLTMYEGGAIVVNNRSLMSQLIERENSLTKESILLEEFRKFQLVLYYFLYHPKTHWFESEFPRLIWRYLKQPLKASNEDYGLNFSVHKVSFFRKQCANSGFYKIGAHIQGQRVKAQRYIEALKNVSGIKMITEQPRDLATYPNLTLLFDDTTRRRRVLEALQKEGLGASTLYSQPIDEYPQFSTFLEKKPNPNARFFADHHIILSTNVFLESSDISRIIALIA